MGVGVRAGKAVHANIFGRRWSRLLWRRLSVWQGAWAGPITLTVAEGLVQHNGPSTADYRGSWTLDGPLRLIPTTADSLGLEIQCRSHGQRVPHYWNDGSLGVRLPGAPGIQINVPAIYPNA